jgi:hypothetical protein
MTIFIGSIRKCFINYFILILEAKLIATDIRETVVIDDNHFRATDYLGIYPES